MAKIYNRNFACKLKKYHTHWKWVWYFFNINVSCFYLLKSIFVIDQTNLKIAQTVKDNTKKKNQKIMYLDSLQSDDDQKIKDGYSYLKAMKYNLKVLKKAL